MNYLRSRGAVTPRPQTLQWFFLFFSCAISSCTSSSEDVATSEDASVTDAQIETDSGSDDDMQTDAGIIEDAEVNEVIACDDPRARPEMDCGTLSWETSPIESRARNHHLTVIAKTDDSAYLIVAGGVNANRLMYKVDVGVINADGAISEWKESTPIPYSTGGMAGLAVKRKIVFAGGMTNNGVTDQSYSANVTDDGEVGEWHEEGSVLHPRMHPGAFAFGDRIYILGGFDHPNVWDDAVSATIESDGTLSEWTSAGSLPGPRSHISVSEVDGYVYIAGGLSESAHTNPPTLENVSRAKISESGELIEWTEMTPLLVPVATHGSFVYGGYIYVVAGMSQTGHEKRVWRSPILEDHTLGDWEETEALPTARAHVHQLPVFGNHVYSVSGAIDYNLNSTTEVHIGTFDTIAP